SLELKRSSHPQPRRFHQRLAKSRVLRLRCLLAVLKRKLAEFLRGGHGRCSRLARPISPTLRLYETLNNSVSLKKGPTGLQRGLCRGGACARIRRLQIPRALTSNL